MNTAKRKRPAVVVGAGIIGLTTAIRLREAGHDVTVLAKETPSTVLNREESSLKGQNRSAYTSVTAGGLWVPAGLEDAASQEWVGKTLDVFKKESENSCGVTLVEGYSLHEHEKASTLPWFSKLTPVSIETPDTDTNVPAIYKSAFKYVAPVVDMEIYLPHLEACAVQKGIVFELTDDVDEIKNTSDWADINTFVQSRFQGQDIVVINCSGIGAEELSGENMQPVRGVAVRVKRPSDVKHFFVEEKDDSEALREGLWAFGAPHGDEYVIGGTCTSGSLSEIVEEREVAAVLGKCEKIITGISKADVLSMRAGIRPLTSSGAVQIGRKTNASAPGLEIVENYGHGGRGVTMCWGCAETVVDAVTELDASTLTDSAPHLQSRGLVTARFGP